MKDKKRLLSIAKIARRSAIILIVLSVVVYLFVIFCEIKNGCKIYDSTLVFIQTVTGLITILVAAETAKWVFIEPQFACEIFDQHDSLFEYIDNKYIPIAIDSDAHIGYLPYSPSDWKIDVVNVGKTAAQNIKVEISKGYDMGLTQNKYNEMDRISMFYDVVETGEFWVPENVL